MVPFRVRKLWRFSNTPPATPLTLVHRARQSQLLQARQAQVESLRVALDSNRMISAAVGVLMATRQLTYDEAFEVLFTTSQHTNTKVAEVARTVLDNTYAPSAAVPAAPGRATLQV